MQWIYWQVGLGMNSSKGVKATGRGKAGTWTMMESQHSPQLVLKRALGLGWPSRVVSHWGMGAGDLYSYTDHSLDFKLSLERKHGQDWFLVKDWAVSHQQPTLRFLASGRMSALALHRGTRPSTTASIKKAIPQIKPGKLPSFLHGFLLLVGFLWVLTKCSASELPLLCSF